MMLIFLEARLLFNGYMYMYTGRVHTLELSERYPAFRKRGVVATKNVC